MFALVGRNLSITKAVVVLAAMQTVYFLAVVILCSRRGLTARSWLLARITAGVGGIVVAVIWWWINKPVEGRTLIALSNTQGITVGDLLSVPALAVAAVVGLGRLGNRR